MMRLIRFFCLFLLLFFAATRWSYKLKISRYAKKDCADSQGAENDLNRIETKPEVRQCAHIRICDSGDQSYGCSLSGIFLPVDNALTEDLSFLPGDGEN